MSNALFLPGHLVTCLLASLSTSIGPFSRNLGTLNLSERLVSLAREITCQDQGDILCLCEQVPERAAAFKLERAVLNRQHPISGILCPLALAQGSRKRRAREGNIDTCDTDTN